MIPFDAPFVPDQPDDRLNPDGSRDTSTLIIPIYDGKRIIDYEVKF